MRPYVWDLVSVLNQNYVQFEQATCDKYFEKKHGVLLYAMILQLVFEQLRTALIDNFEAGADNSMHHLSHQDLENDISANGSKDRSLVKQYLIEFAFLQGVSEQELERVREQISQKDSKSNEKLNKIAGEITLGQQKCHQILLRALSVSSGSTLKEMNALNASVADCDDAAQGGNTLDEDELLTEDERTEKDRLV